MAICSKPASFPPMDTIATLVAGDSPTFCGPRVDGA
ncbi:Uncharacterised protein [Mycobacteroides abscessus subsp. abscessus]|nr:Uncharacterised protein [Mycobacteroides abscessus subsp. abscessus]